MHSALSLWSMLALMHRLLLSLWTYLVVLHSTNMSIFESLVRNILLTQFLRHTEPDINGPTTADPHSFTISILGATVGAVIPIQGTKTKFLIGAGTSLAVLTWNGRNVTSPFIQILTIVDRDKPGNRFNDGKADAVGRLWIGK